MGMQANWCNNEDNQDILFFTSDDLLKELDKERQKHTKTDNVRLRAIIGELIFRRHTTKNNVTTVLSNYIY